MWNISLSLRGFSPFTIFEFVAHARLFPCARMSEMALVSEEARIFIAFRGGLA
jgi:hypothetical protein